MTTPPQNQDFETVAGFGDEWKRFDQTALSDAERQRHFEKYFRVFPWDQLPSEARGFDLGCGSGRWAVCVAPRVGTLHCIDASAAALAIAQKSLRSYANCRFHHASVEQIPLEDGSMDFGYSLGVLHHVPDTAAGIRSCVRKLKPGAPFLLYLYYAFDNRPGWYRKLWRASDIMRRGISRLPYGMRSGFSQGIAATVYFPLARSAWLAERAGFDPGLIPLSIYRDRAFYSMRTDALDRFGTRLEKRFTRVQIETMMVEAGLERVVFSADSPFWCAVGYRNT
jgi:ubiquinone/menaquinone biosynthesis C-methylase UbiE